MKGFFYPRSATGKSSLIPSPPWHYSGDLLTIEFRTDPPRVAELLPTPLTPADEDPGAVALSWADWQSCGDTKEELLDPVRAQYKEAFAVVRCKFDGRTYSRCIYIWVDKDFALLRGIHLGYSKKLGSIHMTRPHFFGLVFCLVVGGRFGATLAADERRIDDTEIELIAPVEKNGFVNGHPMAHHRWIPSIDGKGDVLSELIESTGAKFEGGPPWAAKVEQFKLYDTPTEEMARLEVRDIIGGYYRQIGVTWNGGRTLASETSR